MGKIHNELTISFQFFFHLSFNIASVWMTILDSDQQLVFKSKSNGTIYWQQLQQWNKEKMYVLSVVNVAVFFACFFAGDSNGLLSIVQLYAVFHCSVWCYFADLEWVIVECLTIDSFLTSFSFWWFIWVNCEC